MAATMCDEMFSYMGKQDGTSFLVGSDLDIERKTLQNLQKRLVDLHAKCENKRQELKDNIEKWKLIKDKPEINIKISMLNFTQQKTFYKDLLHIYELLGLTITCFNEEEVHLMFHLTKCGQFNGSYVLEICLNPQRQQLLAKKYTLPLFIPLENILRNYKKLDLKTVRLIASEISDYLYAYTVRYQAIEEALVMYEDCFLNGIQCSVARELVSFTVLRHNISLECSLSYMGLLTIRPDEISVQCTDAGQCYTKEWLHEFQESSGMALAKLSLPVAISSILNNIEISHANQSSPSSDTSNKTDS